ncbi:hypothetical protein [Kribbella speibonae]|uniref:Uncharacterized protein n=2 Tax=Kribbella TaxID=182639 RepID=A0A4R0I990_9ACTN|nr:hypothetical protein [Kribbella speibonae]TCC27994.1 hypothetical protein E0H58_08710 [Kribbella speibonae]TCC29553.1 hypothetical protein E0H92_41765 [Kribbella speibonae]
MLNPFEQDWWDAWNLWSALGQGVQLQPLPPPVPLGPGETAHAVEPCEVQRFDGIRLAFGSSHGNASAAQWRTIDNGTAVLTRYRVLLLNRNGQQDFGMAAVTRMWTEHDGTVLAYGDTQYKLRVPRPVWFDVMLNHVAFNRRIDLVVPPFVQAAWQRAGLIR